ncbi:histone-lysine N-methyltransferase SETDB1-B [Dermacentor silvarum]|uniref:histone-lysine N-methyltransferase SETDB1-B n=1 Tax=Dermacentor silvarum TaxID=543639 RepID=UPI00210089BC|nr:histone-lysine N-methyltransferase SETDB1-B [Dermacentor silvarum]
MPASHNLPPEGPIVRTVLDTSSKVLATHNFPLGVFYKACIIDVKNANDAVSEPIYRVRFSTPKSRARTFRWCHRREMAYAEQATDILPVGTRVVASFSDESMRIRQALYAGLIAEPPEPSNRNRYLVFFDDGYTQYVDTDKVFAMCGSSRDVWEDMHGDMRGFVRSYLEKYPEIPMLRLYKGRKIFAEWHGSWWRAQVLTVDSNLVEILYEADNCTEWIYRGSMRLSLFNMALNQSVQNTAAAVGCIPHDNLVPVTRDEQHVEDMQTKADTQPQFHLEDTVCNENLYLAHHCGPGCLKKVDDLAAFSEQNPLSIPCLLGWKRQIVKQSNKSKRKVYYVAPCRRRLRDIAEVSYYLNLCNSLLTVDLFCFDSLVNVFCEFVPQTVRTFVKDITHGKEQVPVTCVNSIDNMYPTFFEYSSKRHPGNGVELNLDRDFLCGCDCEDDCQDREKCSCQQLTIAATEALKTGRNPNAGYHYRRLLEPHLAGVYECNSWCHCSRRCYNRVVQNGLRARLQVFKTKKCGWGIRCLDDLPQGTFICIYSGQLLNEQAANEDGNQNGDEYLADLNHIEVVEKQKDGYESDVVPASDDDTDKSVENLGYQVSASNLNCELDYLQVFFTDQLIEEMQLKQGQKAQHHLQYHQNLIEQLVGDARKRARVRKQRAPLAEDSCDSKANHDEDSTSNEVRKVNGIKKEENVKSKTSWQNSPGKSGDKSCDSESTEDKPPDAAGGPGKPLDGPCCGGEPQPPKRASTRSFFHEDFCYVINGSHCGNVGRFINHSCSPNVYVQNVFVDTHDLRFPWVAFFAAGHIKAGVELTLDYDYEVGSVPERVIDCHCGSDECRGRLL